MVRRRGDRKGGWGTRMPLLLTQAINQPWSLDFVSDTLATGRRFRQCIVDDLNRECWLQSTSLLSGQRVMRELDRLILEVAHPQ